MANSDPDSADKDRISSQAAERLLARAAELDAHQSSSAEVASLRAAAAEAGIRPEAFDAALAEMRAPAVVPQTPLIYGSTRKRYRIMAAAAVALAAGIVMSQLVPRQASIEQTFELRCLTAPQAAELLRPVLKGSGQVVIEPNSGSHQLTVRARADKMGAVRSTLDANDPAACKIPAAAR